MTTRTLCGCTRPNLPPVPRDPGTIAQGLAEAAETLALLAYRVRALDDEIGEHETAELAALACGIDRAACELRAHYAAKHERAGSQ